MATDVRSPDSIRVGPPHLGVEIQSIYHIVQSLTPAQVNAATAGEQEFTVTGVAAGDYVILVQHPAVASNVIPAGARASDTDKVKVKYVNPSAVNLTPPAGNYSFLVVRREGV